MALTTDMYTVPRRFYVIRSIVMDDTASMMDSLRDFDVRPIMQTVDIRIYPEKVLETPRVLVFQTRRESLP